MEDSSTLKIILADNTCLEGIQPISFLLCVKVHNLNEVNQYSR